MARGIATRAAALVLLVGSFGACSDVDDGPEPTHDGGLDSGVGFDAGTHDATVSNDGGGGDKNVLTSCLDRPDAPLAPPTGALGCELIPPGLSLSTL